jgi:hypothetical protein
MHMSTKSDYVLLSLLILDFGLRSPDASKHSSQRTLQFSRRPCGGIEENREGLQSISDLTILRPLEARSDQLSF